MRAHEGLALPQDIINLIVDELAVLQKDRIRTLRACSLICSSFRFPAQKYLFSQVRLLASPKTWHQQRIANLVNILRKENNLISNIRSLKVVVDYPRDPAPSVMQNILSKSRKIKTKLGLAGVEVDQVLLALNILKNAPVLEEFTLATIPGWMPDNPRNPVYTTLLEMCLIPKLKTLGFQYIKNLPYSFIMGYPGPRAYTQLVLRNVNISLEGPYSPTSFVFAARTVGALEGLKLMRMPSSDFLTPLSPLLPHFKGLRSLEVILPTVYNEREDLWKFILGVSKSLESLELSLNLLEPRGPDSVDVSPVSLRLLTALRTLKFTANDEWYHPNKLNNKINVIGKLLASANSPSGIRSVHIDISVYIRPGPNYRKNGLMHASSVFSISEWSLVDEALSGPMFIDLQSVEMRVIAHTWGSPNDVHWTDVKQGLIMLSSTRPSVSVKAFICKPTR